MGRRADPPRQTILASATLTPTVLRTCATWAPGARLVCAAGRSAAAAVDEAAVAAVDEERAEAAARRLVMSRAKPEWGWGPPEAPLSNLDYAPIASEPPACLLP